MAIIATIKRSFVQFYDYLFKLIFLDMIWFFLISLVFFVGYNGFINGWYLLLIIPIVLTGPFILSGLHIINHLVLKEEVGFKDFFMGIVKYFKRGLQGFLFSFLFYFILIFDFVFFIQKGNGNKIMLIIAVIWLYLIIFFSMMQLFFWGLLTVKKEEGMGLIIKQSFLLTLDNALFTFLWLLTIIILLILFIISVVGLPLLLMGLIGLLIINGTRYILTKYRVESEEN